MTKTNIHKWVAILVSFLMIGTLFSMLSITNLTASAISCQKDGFDKSRYTLSGNMAEDVATIAKSQKGRTGAQFGYTEAWCDEYVADCIENAGADSSIVGHGGTVADFEAVMRKKGAVEVSSPQVGDLVFFTYSHVEIITKVENETVYCAGGNNGGTGNYKTNYCAGERKLYATARLYLRPNYKNINVEPPTNLSIQSDKTTIAAGESILFSYTIENSNDSYIGIDKDGTRYASIPVSGTSGTVSYTFTEPGSYCVIVEGSNPYGYKFCDNGIWILVNEATTPTNLSIQSDKTTIIAGEPISFSYTIENSNDSNIGIDKDGSRYASIPVSGTSGTVSYTFTEPGTYCVIIEGSNPYGYKFCDKGIWILVNEAAPPTNLSIQSDKTTIIAGEPISFSYTIENSNDSNIGIDKDGSRYASIPVSGTSGTISYTFTEPGVYCVIVEGSNPYGYRFCDKGIWISVTYAPGDLNQDGTLSLTDLIPLQQSLLRQTTLTADQAQLADYNGDGSINVLDLMLLKRALLAL